MDFMYSKLVASATEESLQRLEKKQNIISTKSSPQSKQCTINVDYRRSYTGKQQCNIFNIFIDLIEFICFVIN
jgi:hypothetical protein